MEIGLGPGDFVLDEDPASPPQFLAHVYWGQPAGWIKMSLGREVGFSPSDIVLAGEWGPSSPSPKREQSPQFSAVSIVARLFDGSRYHLAFR